MAILNTVTLADEALLVEPACECAEAETCEHADHWRAVEASTDSHYCEDCRYAWNVEAGAWECEEMCRACGREDYELWSHGM